MRSLKRNDRNLKMLLAIGGWTHASNGFTEMVSTYNSRRYFIEKSITYLKKYGKNYRLLAKEIFSSIHSID